MAKIKAPPIRGKGAPPKQASRTLETTGKTVQLNFTVPESFKDEFRDYAHVNRMTLKDVLLESFALLQAS